MAKEKDIFEETEKKNDAARKTRLKEEQARHKDAIEAIEAIEQELLNSILIFLEGREMRIEDVKKQ